MNETHQQNGLTIYRRLWPYLAGYWRIFIISIIGMMIAAGTGPLFAWLIKPLINEGFVDKNLQAMTWIPAAIVGLFIVRGIANFLNEYCTSYLSNHLVQRIRNEMFAKLLRLPNDYFAQNTSGRIMSRLFNDANMITDAGFNILTVSAKDGLNVIGLLALLLYLDWQLTLITFIALPLIAACVRLISKRLRKLSLQNQQNVGRITQILTESINGIRVVKIHGGAAYEQQRFDQAASEVRRNNIKQAAANAISTAVTQLFIAIALAAILYVAASRAVRSDFSAGDFMSFLSAMIMMFDPIKRITGIQSALQRGLAAAQSVFTFLDIAEETDTGTHRLPEDIGTIEWRNVSYRYPEAEKNSLNRINLSIKAGQVVALVGASGCGKTTLANLVPRFFNPDEGAVYIGGQDIRQYTLADLRQHIALVSQDVVLFNGSIAENIAYGQAHASQSDIEQAARAANIWDFIQSQPNGLQSKIGDNGINLSGGQRQRLAIARALLKNAPILILDEATSALDNESERLVQNALEHLMQTRTTLVIAHRLSTIENADEIIVMHEGQIIERGKHAQLLAQNGRYTQLHQLQHHTTG